MKKHIELLAPSGSFESLKAAVQSGANAVYLGGKHFSARAFANNFDEEKLKCAVKYCHIRDVKVFLTVNTLIKQNEIESFLEYVKYLYDINVDALIIQDIGVSKLIKMLLPDFEIHASTQMAAHSLEDVLFLKNAGFSRVVLAREVSLEEVRYICKNSSVDIEIFVHGALCVCYSGQCLMSSMIGNRSGNRGKCAQPCRQKYKMINIITGERIKNSGDYLLSTRDLNTIDEIDKIVDSGAISLKIEGRMKRPEYVATVVSNYKNAIDSYLTNRSFKITDKSKEDLYTIFNRKFTKGYLLGDVGSDIVNFEKPNNMGLYIGKVIGINRKVNRIKIMLEASLKKGDGISLGGGSIGRIIKEGSISEVGHCGEIVELDFVGNAKNGQKVFKTSDGELVKKSQEMFLNKKEKIKFPLKFNLTLKIDKVPVLKISDEKHNTVEANGKQKVEEAIKVPLDEGKIKSQLEKLGDTPYFLDDIKIEMDKNISLPLSTINKLRRDGIDLLNKKRINISGRNTCINIRSKMKKENIKRYRSDKQTDRELKLRVKVKNLVQLESILGYKLDLVYYEDIKTLKTAFNMANEHGFELVYAAPRIIRKNEYKFINENLVDGVSILASTWGSLYTFGQREKHVDCYLNAFNAQSVEFFESLGAKSICLSLEMNLEEIEEVVKYTDVDLESVVYGFTPVMVSEYCPMGVVIKGCKKNKKCNDCLKNKYALKSEDNQIYKITQDFNCRSTVYNSKPIFLFKELRNLKEAGVSIFRLDFSIENKTEIQKVVGNYINLIDKNLKCENFEGYELNTLKRNDFITGHYLKGIE